VNECRGVESVARALATQVAVGQPSQFVVEAGRELVAVRRVQDGRVKGKAAGLMRIYDVPALPEVTTACKLQSAAATHFPGTYVA